MTARRLEKCSEYGNSGEIASNRRDEQELAVLALHLLQSALVYVNTLMIQDVLGGDGWDSPLTDDDLPALTPLFWTHVNPYGAFRLDMRRRLPLAARDAA